MWINYDWNQFKKNLEIERTEWEKFANTKSHIKAECDERIEMLRVIFEAKVQTLRDEAKAKLVKLEKEYRELIAKQTKPTIS